MLIKFSWVCLFLTVEVVGTRHNPAGWNFKDNVFLTVLAPGIVDENVKQASGAVENGIEDSQKRLKTRKTIDIITLNYNDMEIFKQSTFI